MKKFYYILSILALLVSGCSQEEMLKTSSASALKFTASFEQDESRTYVEEGNLLRWTEGDQISLFVGSTLNQQYQFAGKTGANSGYFNKVGTSFGTGNDLKCHYAVYPYASGTEISDNGILTVTLPSEQSYADNSFGLGDNTMVAITRDIDDTYLRFKNVGGYLKLQLYGDNVTVKTIELKGNNNEKIAGTATVTSTYGGNPSVSMADDATETITLDCGENGVKIGASAETATAFWVVLPPTAFEKGFIVTITDVNGGKFEKATSKQFVVERNVIKPMASIEVKPEVVVDEIPYLTFSADAEQSLKMSKAVTTLEYSVNGSEWKELGTNTIYFGGEKGVLQVRGKSLFGTAKNTGDYSQISFGNETPVVCSGDIRTLLDYQNCETANTENAKFCYLFYNCNCLTEAPELPATVLADYCYVNMFNGCKSLIKAPELPATTLSESCYSKMFVACTSLVKAPKLPAMTLALSCYSNMFNGCTSLSESPELPANTLTSSCYQSMFVGCANLTTAPVLPAKTLAIDCYSAMFSGCTSLQEAPELPAKTLTIRCYQSMFSGCNNLNHITMLATNINAISCLTRWAEGVASIGTFIKAKEMESLPNGSSGIPDGWTVKNYGETTDNTPYLTFIADAVQTLTISKEVETLEYSVNGGEWKEMGITKVEFGSTIGYLQLRGKNIYGTAQGHSSYARFSFENDSPVACSGDIRTLLDYENYLMVNTSDARFAYLFFNCINLTSAPQLPSTTLATDCYNRMFWGCSNLKVAPELPAMVLSDGCYEYMFHNCVSLISAPKLPATNLASSCYSAMFNNCSALKLAPELPATTLAQSCYAHMFSGCSSLNQAPKLPATTLASNCYWAMFQLCKGLTSAPVLPAKTLTESCYGCMFFGCNNLNQITVLATDISAGCCLDNWTTGVASTGTFTKAKEMESLPSGINGIPSGWTVKNYGESTDDTPYLTFTADAAQTLTMSKAVETLEYSVGDGNWTELGTTTVSFGGSQGNLRIRGKSTKGTAENENYSSKITFGNETLVACSGDIRTLLDYENFGTVKTENARFCYLFSGCSSLTQMPELPSRTLASYCYFMMFNGCTNLKEVSEIPATTLAEYCCYGMFAGCSDITRVPVLPATTLAKHCYSNMFNGCTNLVKISGLPATTLADHCYNFMFSSCTKLKEVPNLPATTLASNCYRYMFRGCTSLTTAPVLPATTLVEGCYGNMFSDCSKLNNITMLATNVSASQCLYDWTKGTASTGTFIKAKAMEFLPTGTNGIPEGWTIKNYGEE